MILLLRLLTLAFSADMGAWLIGVLFRFPGSEGWTGDMVATAIVFTIGGFLASFLFEED
jgi:hypothetical protein